MKLDDLCYQFNRLNKEYPNAQAFPSVKRMGNIEIYVRGVQVAELTFSSKPPGAVIILKEKEQKND